MEGFFQPTTLLRYYTVHSICDENLAPSKYRLEAAKYQSGEGRCSEPECEKATFTRKGSLDWYGAELRLLRDSSRWTRVEAFRTTDAQCWATADGRHYEPLVPKMVMAVLYHW